jgi:hypothetical protein
MLNNRPKLEIMQMNLKGPIMKRKRVTPMIKKQEADSKSPQRD